MRNRYIFDINSIPNEEKERIVSTLLKWGITTNMEDGTIQYFDAVLPELKCKSIYLIRHAETEAVVKHEFMSDTSSNSALSADGIEITKKQAKVLDDYDFDVALYGPIARVVNTKDIIMEVPQKFKAVGLDILHGIDNTGWEYKLFSEIENDPIFIAREIKNNMFARTPKGTSWGTVIANCADVLSHINEHYEGKNILLISQGSVLQGMQILLRTRKHPWDDFTVSGMYHVGDDSKYKKNYGILSKVF